MRLGKVLLIFILLLAIPIASIAGQLEEGTAAMDSGDYQTAYKLLFPLAEQGDAAAQDCIGAMYCEGLGVEKDEAVAVEWYAKAADQGYAQAQNALGAMYVNGIGAEQNLQKGISLIVKAANQGLEVAQMNAYQLYAEETKAGNYAAMHNFAYMCLKGWGGETEAQSCMQFLEMAAQNGYTKSSNMLSKIYLKGMFGVDQDEEKADFWKNYAENPPEVVEAN